MRHPGLPARLAPATGLLIAGALTLSACSSPDPAPAPASSAPVPSAASTPAGTPTSPSATPSTSAPAPPEPSSGGEESTEPARPVETAAPKKLDESSRTAGAEVSLESVRATTIKATTPGDSSGPGVLVRLSMTNTSSKTLDTSFVQVNVNNDAGDPGTFVSGSPTDPITGSLRSGRTATGTYAFLLDDATSAPVSVLVYVTSGQPVVQFRGRAS